MKLGRNITKISTNRPKYKKGYCSHSELIWYVDRKQPEHLRNPVEVRCEQKNPPLHHDQTNWRHHFQHRPPPNTDGAPWSEGRVMKRGCDHTDVSAASDCHHLESFLSFFFGKLLRLHLMRWRSGSTPPEQSPQCLETISLDSWIFYTVGLLLRICSDLSRPLQTHCQS